MTENQRKQQCQGGIDAPRDGRAVGGPSKRIAGCERTWATRKEAGVVGRAILDAALATGAMRNIIYCREDGE